MKKGCILLCLMILISTFNVRIVSANLEGNEKAFDENGFLLDGEGNLWYQDSPGEEKQVIITDVVEYSATPELISVRQSAYVQDIIVLKADGTVWVGEIIRSIAEDGIWTEVEGLDGVKDIFVVGETESHHRLSGVYDPIKRVRYIILKNDGTVWSWGENICKVLGEDRRDSWGTPIQISGLSNIVSVNGEIDRIVGVKEDGTIWACGLDVYKESRMPSLVSVPKKVKGITDAVSVCADTNYTAVIKKDGSVWQLFKSFDQRKPEVEDLGLAPEPINGLKNIRMLEVYQDIYNANRKLISYTMSTVDTKGNFSLWSVGDQGLVPLHTEKEIQQRANGFILKKDGTLWYGNKQIGGIKDIKAIDSNPSPKLSSVPWEHVAILKKDGTVMEFYDAIEPLEPVEWGEKFKAIPGLKDIVDVKTLYRQTVALKNDGTVWICPEQREVKEATKVENLENVKAISTGFSSVLALKEDGTVWSGDIGGFTQVKGLDDVVSIAVGGKYNDAPRDRTDGGYIHYAAVKKDGSVWLWGENQEYIRMKNVNSSTPVKVRNDLLVYEIDSPYMLLKGEELEVDPGRGTAPVIVADRTLLPIRATIEELGGNVIWDQGKVSIKLDKQSVELSIGSNTAYVNGEEVGLDVAPAIINDRTMVPLRFIIENFDYNVEWNGKEQRIYINKK